MVSQTGKVRKVHEGTGQPDGEVTGLVEYDVLAASLPPLSCHNFSPIRQGTRGSFLAAGTIRRSGVRPATSSRNLVRIASLNLSRSLIDTTNEPGPPMTQSS